jgi:cytoskeletal protein CcmA (bactofilin family)
MADFKLGRLKFVWKGAWNATTAYVKDDIVEYNGQGWVCEVPHTSADFGADRDLGRWTKMAEGFGYKGPWDTNETYEKNSVVTYLSSTWISVTDNNQGNAPLTLPATVDPNWELYAAGYDLSYIDQDIIPSADGIYDLGSDTLRFKDGYFSGDSIYLGPAKLEANETSFTITNGDGTQVIFSEGGFAGGAVVFEGNTIITTNEDEDLQLSANGTGKVVSLKDFEVQGDLEVTGNIQLGGNINIGDDRLEDRVQIDAKLTSSIIPADDKEYDLGSSSKAWRTLYIDRINDVLFDRVEGNTYYVTADGDDDELGTSIQGAFATIKHALSVATAGDTVKIGAGIFEEEFPLTVPQGVAVVGAGIRSTKIRPTQDTNNKDAFLLDGETEITDVTIADMFYDSGADTGYAFRFKSNAVVASRSPYVQRVTVLNRGSSTSPTDPYGFLTGDAGRGAYIDGADVSRNSIEAAILFNECTFIVPNSRALVMTNGARTEWLNCFTYFADLAVEGVVGATGRGGDGKTYLTLTGVAGTFAVGNTVSLYDTDGVTVLGSGVIEAVSGSQITFDGSVPGFRTNRDRTNKIISVGGDAKLSTSIKQFGSASLLLDGDDYIAVGSNPDFGYGTEDFTIEMWIYRTVSGATQIFYDQRTAAPTNYAPVLFINTSNQVVYNDGSATAITGATTIPLNAWSHVALSRVGTSTRLFLNGVQQGSTYTDTRNYIATPIRIGTRFDGTSGFTGRIDELRISKGVARYTANFTVPAAPFNGDNDTVLLLHFDGPDLSTNIVDDGISTQDIRSSGGGTATGIIRYDRKEFAAEMRSISSANVYGNQAVKADGADVSLQLMAHNFAYIGTGADLTNNDSAVVQAAEVIEVNGGRVFFNSVDQAGNFRIGKLFDVNFETGGVSFGAATFDITSLTGITFSEGGNTTIIDPTKVQTGNLVLAGNTLSSLSGNININPSGSDDVILNSDVTVTGDLDVGGNVRITGNITIGDQDTDSVTVEADFTSNLIPDASNTYDLGTSTKEWRTIYVKDAELSGNANVTGNITATGDVAVNGGDLTTSATTFNLVNSNATTVNLAGAGTSVNIGAVTGTTTVRNNLQVNGGFTVNGSVTNSGDLTVTGNLTVNGSTTTINSTTLTVDDKNIELASVDSPTDATADGAGITIKGSTDKTIIWNTASESFTFNQNVNLTPGSQYRIDNVAKLTATTLFPNETTVTIGSTTQENTVRIGDELEVIGDIVANGDIFSDNAEVRLFSEDEQRIELGLVANDIIIGGEAGTTRINHNLDVVQTFRVGAIEDIGGPGIAAATIALKPSTIVHQQPIGDQINTTSTYGTGAVFEIEFERDTGTILSVRMIEPGYGWVANPTPFVGDLLYIPGSAIQGEDGLGPAGGANPGGNDIVIAVTAVNTPRQLLNDEPVPDTGVITDFEWQGVAPIIPGGNTTANIFNEFVETINLGLQAQQISLGAVNTLNQPLGDTVVRNNFKANGDVAVNNLFTGAAGNLTTNALTMNIFNENATTLNIGGAADNIVLGSTFGKTTIRSQEIEIPPTSIFIGDIRGSVYKGFIDKIIDGATGDIIANDLTVEGDAQFEFDITVQGGNIVTTQQTFNLLDNVVETMNFAGSSTLINIGSLVGTTNIKSESVVLEGSLNVKGGEISTNATTFDFVTSGATTVNMASTASTVSIGSTNGTTVINNELNVRLNANIEGTTLSTTNTTFNLINDTAQTVNIGGEATSISLGEATGTFFVNSAVTDVAGNITVRGGTIQTDQSTFNLINSNATTVNFAGVATSIVMGAGTGTTEIRHNLDVNGDVNIDGGDLTVSTSTFNLANTTATTINLGGAATSINLGFDNGITNIKHDLNVRGNLLVGDTTDLTPVSVINGVGEEFYLANTTVNAVYIGGSAEIIELGSTLGTTSINHDLLVDGETTLERNLLVKGDEINTNREVFDLVNTTASTVNFAGAATTLNIASNSGTTTVNNDLVVIGDVTVQGGDIVTNQTVFNIVDTTAQTVNFARGATSVNIAAASGTTTVNNELRVEGILTVDNHVLPAVNVAYDLGSPTNRFRDLYLSGNTIDLAGGTISYDGTSFKFQGGTNVGESVDTESQTFDLLNAIATTINFGGDATTLNIGAASGNTNVRNNLNVSGKISIGSGAGASIVTYGAELFDDIVGLLGTNIIVFTVAGTVPNPVSTRLSTLGSGDTIEITSNSGIDVFTVSSVSAADEVISVTVVEDINSTLLNVTSVKITSTGAGASKLETTETEFFLVNERAETVYIAGAATSVVIGALGGFTTLNTGLLVDGSTEINNNLTVNGNLTLTSLNTSGENNDFNISPQGTGRVIIEPAGGLIINPATLGDIDNVRIGETVRASAKTTTLDANGQVRFTAGISSVDTTTGTVVVTGGLAVSENINVEGNLSANELTLRGRVLFDDQLTVPNGGTGTTQFNQNGILYGNTTNAVQSTLGSNPGVTNITDSNAILTTTAAGVPVWTDVIDCGTF